MLPKTRFLSHRVSGVLVGSLLVTAAGAAPPLDLTGWTLFDPDNDWSFSNPTPASIKMVELVGSGNVHPGWVVSDFALAATVTIEFDLSVSAGTSDDDFIGFGFSWIDGDHSWLLDWKRATQSYNWGQPVLINDDVAEQGLKIKRINGGYTWDGLWGGVDGLGVTTIAGPAGGPWVAGTTYKFVMQLSPGQIVISRDGSPLFNVIEPSFPGGQGSIALYGFSQNGINLSNVCITPTPTNCPEDLNNDGQVNGADLGLLLASWGGPGLGDLNADNIVNGADLGLLLAAWGSCA